MGQNKDIFCTEINVLSNNHGVQCLAEETSGVFFSNIFRIKLSSRRWLQNCRGFILLIILQEILYILKSKNLLGLDYFRISL